MDEGIERVESLFRETTIEHRVTGGGGPSAPDGPVSLWTVRDVEAEPSADGSSRTGRLGDLGVGDLGAEPSADRVWAERDGTGRTIEGQAVWWELRDPSPGRSARPPRRDVRVARCPSAASCDKLGTT